MITHEYKTKDYEQIFGEKLSLPKDTAILNMDSGKDMLNNGKWQPQNGEIVSMALIHDGVIKVFVKDSIDDPEFYLRIKAEIDSLVENDVKLFALYKDTEEGMLFGKFGVNYFVSELRATFSDEALFWRRDSFIQILKERGIIQRDNFNEPFSEPKQVIALWGKFVTTGETSTLTYILDFTLANAIKETILFLNRGEIRKHLEERKKGGQA
jgi:hypothetical protein